MHRLTTWTLRPIAVLILAAALPGTPAARAAAPVRMATPAPLFAEDAPEKCCFTNPGYTGTCEVQPSKDESCGQILAYLNNPMAQGKSYCGNTTVRSGWKQASCDTKK